MSVIKAFKSKQFFLFICTGGIAALFNFISRIIYSYYFSFSIAIVLAYLTGMTVAFILAKIFVFKKTENTIYQSLFYFTLVNLFALIQTFIVTMNLEFYLLPRMNIVFLSKEIAHAIGIIVPIFTSYIGHKKFSFKM